MDQRTRMMRVFDDRYGNLANSIRARIVTVTAVNTALLTATIQFAQPDAADDPPDPMDVPFLESYLPVAGDLAYLATLEGSPVLMGSVETEVWHTLSLPTGYSTVSPYAAPAYKRDSLGRVWLRGAANVTASNAVGTKFTLPVGWRPLSGTQALAAPYSNGTAVSGQLRYDVGLSGNINTLVVTPAATVLVMFEGLSFDIRL